MHIKENTFRFFAQLARNNHTAWFDAHRREYRQQVRLPLLRLGEDLSPLLGALLPECEGPFKLSRINRDTRFSRDKTPYKTRMWLSFAHTGGPGEIFVAVNTEGCYVGVGLKGGKQADLAVWRQNIQGNAGIWQRYFHHLQQLMPIRLHIPACYKRQVITAAPASLQPLSQAKAVWFLTLPDSTCTTHCVHNCFIRLCRMAPIFLFMRAAPRDLSRRLSELGSALQPPDARTDGLWTTLQSPGQRIPGENNIDKGI